MLFNPKWEKSSTLAEFAEWLEKQPKSQVYDYHWPLFCAVGQWLTSRGDKHNQLTTKELIEFFGEDGHRAIISHPQTFGALLKRIRELK